MLNQFYNYLSSKIIEYFEQGNVKCGDKYFIQLDEIEQVNYFYQTLKKNYKSSEFIYKHDKGDKYYTFSLGINSIKLVVVNGEDVTSGYLVNLRNNVGDQEGVWKNTALFIICTNAVDSIYGGMADLQKAGMPLNGKNIIKKLYDDIAISQLSRIDKEITKFYLNKKEEELFQSSLWDYQEVLGIINKQSIPLEDYNKLYLFPDNTLDEFKSANQIQKRLEENYNLYNRVSRIQEFDEKDSQLEKLFDEKGIKALKDKEWFNTDFSKVKNSFENFKNSKSSVNYLENPEKKTDNGLVYWEKSKEKTETGKRKRQIIIFNTDNVSEVKLTLSFDQRLSKEFLNSSSQRITKVSGKKLYVSFPLNVSEPTFNKITYKHKNNAKSLYEFNIVVINLLPNQLKSIKLNYQIDTKNKKIILINDSEDINFIFGESDTFELVSVDFTNKTIDLDDDTAFKIADDSPAWEEGNINFNLKYQGALTKFELKEEVSKIYPVKSIVIWKDKREKQLDFEWKGSKVTQDTESYYIEEKFKYFLQLEQQIINKKIKYGKMRFDYIDSESLTLSPKLEECYLNIINYFSHKNNIPSLVYIDEELYKLYDKYIQAFNEEILSIQENSILSDQKEKQYLLKLGTIEIDGKLLLSPLSPLNVAYQLEIYRQCKNEKISKHILERLNARNLLPYLFNDEGVLYRSVHRQSAEEWIVYERSSNVTLGETNEFIANVVKEKIKQFICHFKYLFNSKSYAPIKINLINLENDKEVLRGIINFLKDGIEKNRIIPVDINIYNHFNNSSFDTFFNLNNIGQLETEFHMKFNSKSLDPMDTIRLIQENINYSKHYDFKNIEYAHISFFKVRENNERTAKDNMDEIDTGLSLNGLLSTVTSVTGRTKYRTGFGSKNILNKDLQLITTSILLNELASNCDNYGDNPYSKNKTIVIKPMEIDENLLEQLYNKSHWVTFIEPNFGLEYFSQHKQHKEDLLIIHYSEQYTSSDKYDTITVTNKTKQYKQIIKEFLLKRQIVVNEEQLDYAIKCFNSINGEWLLNVISSHSEYEREKLSIISAVKYTLTILDNPKIKWIPISMEEILRISGAVKLNKSEGIFTIKNLKQKGVHSDDLLFIGIQEQSAVLKVYFYPVEVKIGYNFSSTIEKGKNQINKTYSLLREQLYSYELNENYLFRNKFFRNFFIKILFANEQRFVINNIWNEKDLLYIENLKSKLLNDDYQVSFDLEPLLGKGALISFKKENSFRSIKLEEDILVVELTEDDAYEGIAKTIKQINDDIHRDSSDIDNSMLLINKDISNLKINTNDDGFFDLTENREENVNADVKIKEHFNAEQELDTREKFSPNNKKNNIDIKFNNDIKSEAVEKMNYNTRFLLGKAEGSTHNIYWEYGHNGLANRHMLIEGKSGQGKTYFIQCILSELSNAGIPAIIIDYTEGFKSSQLEPLFKDFLGSKLIQYLVAKDKFPLNPFKRCKKELDENFYIDEDNIDIAERFKSVIGAVYSDLGAQQLNCIYQATIRGLEKYDDMMDLSKLREQLQEDSSTQAKTALAQLSLLIDKNPFSSKEGFKWDDILKKDGSIFVIQLTGYTRDVQKIITEIILWDLWNYKVQTGSKEKPFAVVLDEAQNLNFNDHSPCTRILTEGRKFGWSAWFATQSLKGNMTKSAINRLQNAAQKIYFSPAEEVISDIANILGKGDKKYWEKKISELKKGECIIYGPTLNKTGDLNPSRPIKIQVTDLKLRK